MKRTLLAKFCLRDFQQVNLVSFQAELLSEPSKRQHFRLTTKGLTEQWSHKRWTCITWRIFISISCQKGWVAWLATGVLDYICMSWPESKTVDYLSSVSKDQICLLCAKIITNKDFKQNFMMQDKKDQIWVNWQKGDLPWWRCDKRLVPKLCR